MKRVLLTGMSGTGKSTLVQELAGRGYRAYDADDGGLSEVVDVSLDEITGIGPGKDWVWVEDRVRDVLSSEDCDVLFLAGCSPNQHKFYSDFDCVILLTAPAAVIAQRLASRTNNRFGKAPDEVARTLQLKETVEPALRVVADLELDTSAPLEEVIAAVLSHVLRDID